MCDPAEGNDGKLEASLFYTDCCTYIIVCDFLSVYIGLRAHSQSKLNYNNNNNVRSKNTCMVFCVFAE